MLTTGLAGAMFASNAATSATPALGAGRSTETTHSTEVLVVGGGPAGMAAATMAAWLGRKVLLVERYGRMGGMAVQAMVGPLMGSVNSKFADEVLQRIGGRHFDSERLDLQYAAIVHLDLRRGKRYEVSCRMRWDNSPP